MALGGRNKNFIPNAITKIQSSTGFNIEQSESENKAF